MDVPPQRWMRLIRLYTCADGRELQHGRRKRRRLDFAQGKQDIRDEGKDGKERKTEERREVSFQFRQNFLYCIISCLSLLIFSYTCILARSNQYCVFWQDETTYFPSTQAETDVLHAFCLLPRLPHYHTTVQPSLSLFYYSPDRDCRFKSFTRSQ